MSGLTDAQLHMYNSDGYALLYDVFGAADLTTIRQESDRIVELCLNSSIATHKRNPRLDAYAEPGSQDEVNITQILPFVDVAPLTHRLCGTDTIMGPIRQLLGGDQPVMVYDALVCKQRVYCPAFRSLFELAEGQSDFTLHCDWYPFRALEYAKEGVQVAIFVDSVRTELGPMRVLPGTHCRDWHTEAKRPDVPPGTFHDEDYVEIVAPGGTVMIFQSRLLHDSLPNVTNEPRRALNFTYYPCHVGAKFGQHFTESRKMAARFETVYRMELGRAKYLDQFKL